VTNDWNGQYEEGGFLYAFDPITNDKPIYVSVETYYYNIVPSVCTYGTDNGGTHSSPVAFLQVFENGVSKDYAYYVDVYSTPLMIENYTAGQQLTIFVGYYWYGSPKRDFTVKVYSKDDLELYDEDRNTNMLHNDGTEPSEFDECRLCK
jgi:hypothetical protein